MMNFGYVMPKDTNARFENFEFWQKQKTFKIWVLKPHMWQAWFTVSAMNR